MKLTKDQVVKVGKLANLNLKDDELETLSQQLSETLEFVEQLNQIDTSNIDATYQVTGLNNITRPDETAPSLTQSEALQNAKVRESGYFKVKAVFEEQ